MKRSWIGLGLMVLLLVGGILSTYYMDRCHSRTAQLLETAAAEAAAGNWEQAVSLSRQAESDWQQNWHRSAAFADHEPMEEIDSQFAQLEVYAQTGERLTFSALCAYLSSLLRAIGDAQIPNWWNLL